MKKLILGIIVGGILVLSIGQASAAGKRFYEHSTESFVILDDTAQGVSCYIWSGWQKGNTPFCIKMK